MYIIQNQIMMMVPGHTHFCGKDLPVEQWQRIVIAQYEENGTFYNKLTINGAEFDGCTDIWSNPDPKNFENLQVREERKIQK